MFKQLYTVLILLIGVVATCSGNTGILKGKVSDEITLEPLIGAEVIWVKGEKILKGTTTDVNGEFVLEEVEEGEQQILIKYIGYEKIERTISVKQEENAFLVFTLNAAIEIFTTIEVIGASPTAIRQVHGTATKLSTELIQLIKPVGTQELLAQVPGINGFADDGMGNSRLNIGVRGLNPRRSSRVLVLEDGIPIQPAIYVYPNMYYNPPVERLDEIEVIKGSGAIKYGPQTMGAVINYITKRPRKELGGTAMLTGGTNGYASAYAEIGGFGTAKLQPEIQLLYKRGDGFRNNNQFEQYNGTFKLNWFPDKKRSLYIKGNFNYEDANATYTGLTEYSFQNDPTFNPKQFDQFTVKRSALDLIYTREFNENLIAKTKGYVTHFDRDWWRENDVFVTADLYEARGYEAGDAIPTTDYANVAQQILSPLVRVGNGKDNFGILREFFTLGVEHSINWNHQLGEKEGKLLVGGRLHFERFLDDYKFGFQPDEREGVFYYEDSVLVEGVPTAINRLGKHDTYETTALSIFVEEKIDFGRLSITPGFRFEAFEQIKIDKLRSSIYKDKTTLVFLPGIGFNYETANLNYFGGVHRGFTPPTSGTLAVLDFGADATTDFDLKAEKSWNSELGFRGNTENLQFEIAAFHIYVEDLVAAGRGSIFSNLGKVQTYGIESMTTWKLSAKKNFLPDVFVNYTYLETEILDATIAPTPASPPSATTDGFVDISGNELTYAPHHNLTAGFMKTFDFGLTAKVDVRYVSAAFTDFENLTSTRPAGNQGKTDAYYLLNANLKYQLNPKWTVFATGKNLLDQVYIGSRLHSSATRTDAVGSSGILVGPRRQISIGVKYDWN